MEFHHHLLDISLMPKWSKWPEGVVNIATTACLTRSAIGRMTVYLSTEQGRGYVLYLPLIMVTTGSGMVFVGGLGESEEFERMNSFN